MSALALMEPDVEEVRYIEPESLFEIVDGRRVELPLMSVYAEQVAMQTYDVVHAFVTGNDMGKVQHEILFRLPLPKNRSRRPDVSFISYQRWPKRRPFPYRGNARDVVPDLAVEVVSPNDLIEELMTKLDEYFRAGVRLVWVVHCNLRQIYVYQSLTSIRVFTEAEELEGGDVLPGFRTPIGRLFPDVLLDETPPLGR